MKIFFWAASMVDGTWWYRLHLVAEALKARGHECRIGGRVSEWARDEAQIIVGQRVCHPRSAIGWRELAAAGRWRMVYEVDDNLLQIDPRTNDLAATTANRAQAFNMVKSHLGALDADRLPAGLVRTDPGHSQPFQDFRDPAVQAAMRECITRADMVTVTVPQLAEVLRPLNGNSVVLPNSIPASLLDMKPQRYPLAGRVVLGWQGSSTHTDDWEVAAEAVRGVLWDHEYDTHMRFVGTPHPGGMRINQVSYLGWTTDLWEHYRRVSRFHVGLAPLRDTVFNASKSPLRAVEMMALGVPGVYSKVPAYEAIVEHGVTGFLARTSADWREYLNNLIASPGLRAQMGDAAREAARAWTIEDRVSLWESAYQSLL